MDRKDKAEGKFMLYIWPFAHVKTMTMLAVVIAILAVDFPDIFYRTLCKTEELGISLMDTGVALITLNAGMSGPRARPWFNINSFGQWMKEFSRSINAVVFPIIIGWLRIIILEDFNYQEHPSEYGTHWNFFTTIAVVAFL